MKSARAFYACMLLAVFVACDSSDTSGPRATPTPGPGASTNGYTFSDPGANCVHRSESFQYSDAWHKNGNGDYMTLPWIKYSPGPHIFYYLAKPSPLPGPDATDIGYEIANPKDAPTPNDGIGEAYLIVPAMSTYFFIGTHDQITFMMLPTSQLSADYKRHITYMHLVTDAANKQTNDTYNQTAPPAGTTPPPPTSTPTPNPDQSWDMNYTQNEQQAVQAISRGLSGDDSVVKKELPDYILNEYAAQGEKPLTLTCLWLQDRTYDIYADWVKKRLMSEPRLSKTIASLKAQGASDDEITNATYIAYERDEYWSQKMMPIPWKPDWAMSSDQRDYIWETLVDPTWTLLYSDPVPAPDDTANP